MIEYLIGLDSDLFLRLHSGHTLFWDYFMFAMSDKFTWIGLYVAILYSIWRSFPLKTTIIIILGVILAVVCSDQLTAGLLRPMIGRLRPSNAGNPISEFVTLVNGYRGGTYGFPSSHASNTFAVAILISLIFKNWRVLVVMYAWALLNCYSRIYLGVHYPGDLLVGALIGSLIGVVVYFIIRGFMGNYNKRRFKPSDMIVICGVLTLVFVAIGYLL